MNGTSLAAAIARSVLLYCGTSLCAPLALAQAGDEPPLVSQLDDIEIVASQLPVCFGMRDITEPRALAICDALALKENVRARELSEIWVRTEPENPAAQFALAEVLFNVEANMPRSLFHLMRAEELTNYSSLGRALASGNIEWHYLALSQLSYVYQLMGDQLKSLEYLDKLEEIYAQDVESFRGWPLIKMKQYDAARASANKVLETSTSERERARAWNTLCAVELASLQPRESLAACERAISEDENIANTDNNSDTVYLVNASEVSLSLLQMEDAERYLDRASRNINPDSVANPWIYKLYLTMNQGRFDDARSSLDRMLLWRESQVPVVGIMNRAEHLLAAASFLLLLGYADDAARLTTTALNEPDRNGSFSADDDQKDSIAALMNHMANQAAYQQRLEQIASEDFLTSIRSRLAAQRLALAGWRSGRKAASLFAGMDILLNRLRPYAPLDVHIPEWVEPELIALMGTGVMSNILEQARTQGAFMLNDGYYHAYATEVAAVNADSDLVMQNGLLALQLLPAQEVLLRARLQARLGEAAWKLGQYAVALEHYQAAWQRDPGVLRRLGTFLPVSFRGDGSEFARQSITFLKRSPRFRDAEQGFIMEVSSTPDQSACLRARDGTALSCLTMEQDVTHTVQVNAAVLVNKLHKQLFNLDYEISEAQIALLLGTSVILSAQQQRAQPGNRRAILQQ